jgi:hypothetical protein
VALMATTDKPSPMVLRRMAWHCRTRATAHSVGISLEALRGFVSGTINLTDDQLKRLQTRMRETERVRYK